MRMMFEAWTTLFYGIDARHEDFQRLQALCRVIDIRKARWASRRRVAAALLEIEDDPPAPRRDTGAGRTAPPRASSRRWCAPTPTRWRTARFWATSSTSCRCRGATSPGCWCGSSRTWATIPRGGKDLNRPSRRPRGMGRDLATRIVSGDASPRAERAPVPPRDVRVRPRRVPDPEGLAREDVHSREPPGSCGLSASRRSSIPTVSSTGACLATSTRHLARFASPASARSSPRPWGRSLRSPWSRRSPGRSSPMGRPRSTASRTTRRTRASASG